MRAIPDLRNLFPSPRGRRAGARLASALCLALALASCKSYSNDVTGSINPAVQTPSSPDAARLYVQQWGQRYAADPNDKTVAMNYALALHGTKQYAQAVAVLEKLAIRNSSDLNVLGAYGKALADDGRLQEAARVLANAHTPARPNWTILSAQGNVADLLGDHATAQDFYKAALRIAPGQPSLLSNLGLSYALSKQLPKAEKVLREAAAKPQANSRVRQNLALVLALRGKFAEAEAIDRQDLPAAQAAANVMAVRNMIAQSNTWKQIQQSSPQPAKTPGTKARSHSSG